MKVTLPLILTLVCAASLAGNTLVLENYESLQPGDSEPNFPGIKSNFPAAVIQVAADLPDQPEFRNGNTRYFRWESLSGLNPDATGFHGGPSTFFPFPGGPASVVSVGFDFIIGANHGELLFGVGQQQSNRSDDQNFGVRIVIRGDLGIHGKAEIATTIAGDAGDQGLKNGVPYRVEVVANQSGSSLDYMSPIGPMSVGNERFDLYLMNIETGVYQLIFDDSLWHVSPMSLDGFWWTTYPYTSTGRPVDIKLDNIAVYENEIVLTGFDEVRPGPASAYIDFDHVRPASKAPEALWYLPGKLVMEPASGKTFGANNIAYFDTDGASLPNSWSDEFRFADDLGLLSIGFDVQVDRDEVITSFSDGHDEVFLAFSGGDTRANAQFTSILKIRGTRSVGNDGDPAEAEPTLQLTGTTSGTRGFEFNWSTPYRLQVLFNQSGETRMYDTPWESGVTIGNEMAQLYLYNYLTGERLEGEEGTPYYIEASFLNGLANSEGVKGTLRECFWKTVTGRRIDLRLDNIAVLENELVVTDPGAQVTEPIEVMRLGFSPVPTNPLQPQSIKMIEVEFRSVPGSAYGVSSSTDLTAFSEMNTLIPGSNSGPTTTVKIPTSADTRFIFLKPLRR